MSQGPAASDSSIFTSRSAVKWLTILCLAGLAVGIVAGMLVGRIQPAGSDDAVAIADALVRAWTNGLRVLVLPLIVARLYLAIAGERGTSVSTGRLGLTIPIVFGGLLAVTAIMTLFMTPALLSLPWFPDVSLAAAAAPVAESAPVAAGSAWVDSFIPPNLFVAATSDNILALMLFTLVFALAMRKAEAEHARTMLALFSGMSHALFTLVGWLLLFTPIVMLAIGFRSSLNSGVAVGGVILSFAAMEIVVLLIAILMMYVIAGLVAGVSVARFARALWPAQLTAIATRSSLATLPALMTGATQTLGLRPETAASVLPVSGAVLKLSRAVSGPAKLLFIAHVLDISITPDKLLIFAITIMLFSTTTMGVPKVTSGNRSLPAYVAAGVPAEYVLLLGIAVSLTDIFLTLLNSTGYMTAAALVDRFGTGQPRETVASQPASEVVPEQTANVA